MELVKQCKDCGETKAIAEFPVGRPRIGPWYALARCKPCSTIHHRQRKAEKYRNDPVYRAKVRAQQNEYWSRPGNREKERERGRIKNRVKRFGLAPDDLYRMLDAQGYACAICSSALGLPHESRAFAVDHDHLTGEVRTLLCDSCNMGLAQFKEDPWRLNAALQYLGYWHTRRSVA